MRDQLEKLVQEMLDKGVLYDDARREFEKMFIARALQRSKGNVGNAAECSACTATPSPGRWRSTGSDERVSVDGMRDPASDHARPVAPSASPDSASPTSDT